MNTVQNVNELNVASLSPDYKRTSETITQSNALQKNAIEASVDGNIDGNVNENINITVDKNSQVNATSKTSEDVATKEPLSIKQLDNVAQQLQEFMSDLNRDIKFSVDKESGRDVIKVIDNNSGDILKQYPSEEVLSLVSKLSDMAGGFVDEKV